MKPGSEVAFVHAFTADRCEQETCLQLCDNSSKLPVT